MSIENRVFEALNAKVELQSQRYDFSIIDDLRKEFNQKGINVSNSELFANLRNKSKTALVDLGTISNQLKPIEDAIMTLKDDGLKRQLAAFKVDINGQFNRHKKLESLLTEAAKA